MGKSWGDVYDKPADVAHFIENINVHKDFLDEMCKDKPCRVVEVGCGSGTLSVFMSHMGSEVTAVDVDDEVLERARKASKDLNGSVKFMRGDAFSLPFGEKEFDIAFSQGVFEHFSDEDIIKMIAEQLRVAKKVLFSVPNKNYNHKDFGNERLMTRLDWENMLSDFDVKVSADYYHIRTKRNLMRALPIMYMAGVE